MDTVHAPVYDERWGSSINRTHRENVDALLSKLGPGATVLDAACGTGKYWPLLLSAGVKIIGVDHSRAMLATATHKHPEVPVVHGALQDLSDLVPGGTEVHALLCIDAMENWDPRTGRSSSISSPSSSSPVAGPT